MLSLYLIFLRKLHTQECASLNLSSVSFLMSSAPWEVLGEGHTRKVIARGVSLLRVFQGKMFSESGCLSIQLVEKTPAGKESSCLLGTEIEWQLNS